MPRSFNQKLKILYVKKVLEEKSDRDHPCRSEISLPIFRLMALMQRERQFMMILRLWRLFGLNILNRRGKVSGYYLEEEDF